MEDTDDGSAGTTPEYAPTGVVDEVPQTSEDCLRWTTKTTRHDIGAGVRGAFPDLDKYNSGGSSDDDEEHREAMRYLRQVR